MATRTLTHWLVAWSRGQDEALDRLAPLVYGKLRRLAANYMRRERPGHTLETEALVNEAFLRLLGQEPVSWKNRSHFFAIAALTMRRLLIERGRRRRVLPLPLAAAERTAAEALETSAVEEALRHLGARHPQARKIVELRFFGGLNESEIAGMLGLSIPTVKRRWRFARAWLHRHLSQSEPR